MKSQLKSIATLSIVLPLLLCGCRQQAQTQARKILRKTEDTYKQLKSYQDKTTFVSHTTGQGFQHDMEATFSLALKRPNKFAIVLQSGSIGSTLVCDGNKFWMYTPMVNQYAVESAPRTLEGILTKAIAGLKLMIPGGFMILPLFKTNIYETLMENAEEVELIEDETLDGSNTYHLIIRRDIMDVELWIDTQDFVIRKVSMNLAKMTERQQREGETGRSAGMKTSVEELHQNIRLNQEIPDEVFVFAPPEGAQETDQPLTRIPRQP